MSAQIRNTRTALAVTTLLLGGVFTALPGEARADSGHQKFTITTVDREPSTVVAKGPISGEGIETNNHLTKQPGENFQATLSFPDGDVFLDVQPGAPDVKFNPNTCVTKITETDTFSITGATGAYEGVTGSGSSKLRITLEGARTAAGECAGPGTPPISSHVVVKGKGTVVVP